VRRFSDVLGRTVCVIFAICLVLSVGCSGSGGSSSSPAPAGSLPTVPDGFTHNGANAQGMHEYTHDETGIEFVLLPGGEFQMGSPDTEPNRLSNEGPVHTVTLSPFLIAKTEVTQAEYEAVMAGNTAGLSATPSSNSGVAPLNPQRPVEGVSFNDLQDDDGFLARTGLSLPSEAQWEYACRAGQAGPFSGTGELDDMGWFVGNAGGSHHPVGTKEANQFGLFDMHGNVFEWCEDVYNAGFYATPEAAGPDPVATSGSVTRGIRILPVAAVHVEDDPVLPEDGCAPGAVLMHDVELLVAPEHLRAGCVHAG
jgi:formylglycine-generating enzyme required for sulfatase activity